MRYSVMMILLAIGLPRIALAVDAPPAPTESPAPPHAPEPARRRIVSPEVSSDGRVTFRLDAPKAPAVSNKGLIFFRLLSAPECQFVSPIATAATAPINQNTALATRGFCNALPTALFIARCTSRTTPRKMVKK